jgi:hypothetical protein
VTPVIAEVRVVDDPEAWRSAGFMVAGDFTIRVGTTRIRLVDGEAMLEPRRGITGWTLAGVPVSLPDDGMIDGLPTELADDDAEAGGAEVAEAAVVGAEAPELARAHPNGVTRVDHMVVLTPDLERTTAALHGVGLEPRRTREAGPGPDGVERRQRFFRLGEVILELVGPITPTGTGPARFWGLAYVVDDLDTTAAGLGDLLSRPRDAVQPGRRIAALRPSAGLAVPTAFLTPDRRPATTG